MTDLILSRNIENRATSVLKYSPEVHFENFSVLVHVPSPDKNHAVFVSGSG